MVFEKSARVGGIQGNAWARGGFWFNYYRSSSESTFFWRWWQKTFKRITIFFLVFQCFDLLLQQTMETFEQRAARKWKENHFCLYDPQHHSLKRERMTGDKKGQWQRRRLLAFFCELARLQRWWWFCSGKWRLPCTHCGSKVAQNKKVHFSKIVKMQFDLFSSQGTWSD